MKESHYELEVPIYGHKINIWVTKDIEKVCKQIEAEYDLDLSNCYKSLGCTFTLEDDFNLGLILDDKKDINSLTHECVHLTYMIYDSIDVELNFENQELMSYMTGSLVEAIYEKIWV